MTDPKPENPGEAFGLQAVPDVEETIEPPLSEVDQADLDALTAEPPSYHTLLEVWQNVLEPATREQTQPVQPGWASRITSAYPQIKIQQMREFRDRYFGKILELYKILENEIAEDPDALQHLDAESDATENRHHYINLLFLWQAAIVQWEKDWDCEDELSAVELGAISEVHRMFFNETGVTSYLDNIGFQFDSDDQEQMTLMLNEIRSGDHE